jgi:hypothetical protein
MSNLPQKYDNQYKETKAAELLTHHAKTTAGIIGKGHVLTEMKEALPHGEFTEWMSKYCRIKSSTSLRYRRSYAFATSTGDFASVKLETMALYFCADIYAEISKPIHNDHDQHAAMQAGLKAVEAAARKRLIDKDEAKEIYSHAFNVRYVMLFEAKPKNKVTAPPDVKADNKLTVLTAKEPADSLPVRIIVSDDNRATDAKDCVTLVGSGSTAPSIIRALIERDDIAAQPNMTRSLLHFGLRAVMRAGADEDWLREIKAVGEVAFRRHVDHMNALVEKLNAVNGAIKAKADRAEAKARSGK